MYRKRSVKIKYRNWGVKLQKQVVNAFPPGVVERTLENENK
jgi:hypothetical protein